MESLLPLPPPQETSAASMRVRPFFFHFLDIREQHENMISVGKNNQRESELKNKPLFKETKSWQCLKLHQGCLEPASTFYSAWEWQYKFISH